MTPTVVLLIALGYAATLLGIAAWTSARSDQGDSESRFFTANRQAPWFVVAFGMVGASLSGVTFLSIPGWVRDQEWTYMQMVIGYCIGYVIVATILLPLYYRMNVTSIYRVLGVRLGVEAHRNRKRPPPNSKDHKKYARLVPVVSSCLNDREPWRTIQRHLETSESLEI